MGTTTEKIRKTSKQICSALKELSKEVEFEGSIELRLMPIPVIRLFASIRKYAKVKERYEIRKNVIKAYKLMMRALANENRLDILYSLCKKPKTWTDLLFELQMNLN